MKRLLSVFAGSLTMVACQPMAAPPAPAPEVYFSARGNEPGWVVRFDPDTIAFEGDYGDTKISVAKPQGRASFNGMRYITEQLTVDVTHAICTDGMSGQRYAETVLVLANNKEYRGCGGRKLPPASLDDTVWKIVMLDQTPALEQIPTELRFADGKVSGSGGCNRFSGAYTTKGSDIIFEQITSTEMACPESQMVQEAKFLKLLNGKVSERYTVDGDLILANERGQRATLRQII